MTILRQMSYKEFGKLRFLDFFPKTDGYMEDHEGGIETGIGLACTEGYRDTMFTSPADEPWHTAEITLSFEGDCPEAEGHALVDSLGLPLRKGMSDASVRQALGVATGIDLWPIVVGEKWPYYLGCILSKAGLVRVWICRKDLADAQTELES